MFASVVHLLVTAVLGVLCAAAVASWRQHHRTYSLIVSVVIAGLVYDNAVLGLGRWLGEGSLLEGLSWPRFLVHALVTPLLIIVGFGAARSFGLGWAQRRDLHAAACSLATLLVGWGLLSEVFGLALEPQRDAGVLSYGAASTSAPVPAIATILVLVAVGAALWKVAGWPWLAVGALVMFVASGLGGVSPLLTNVGELALAASLVATERQAGRREHSWSVAARSPSRVQVARSRAARPRHSGV
jgi:hypothetical protein